MRRSARSHSNSLALCAGQGVCTAGSRACCGTLWTPQHITRTYVYCPAGPDLNPFEPTHQPGPAECSNEKPEQMSHYQTLYVVCSDCHSSEVNNGTHHGQV